MTTIKHSTQKINKTLKKKVLTCTELLDLETSKDNLDYVDELQIYKRHLGKCLRDINSQRKPPLKV